MSNQSTEFLSEYASKKVVKPDEFTEIEWEEPHKNLGIIKRGTQMDIDFPFENTGDYPLVIDTVKVSCDCTLFNVPKDPIKPGKEGKIMVRFITKDLPLAMMTRHVYVKANTTGSPYHTLSFKLELVE